MGLLVALRQRTARNESADARRDDGRVRAARQHHLRVAVPDVVRRTAPTNSSLIHLRIAFADMHAWDGARLAVRVIAASALPASITSASRSGVGGVIRSSRNM